MVITQNGMVIRMPVKGIRVSGRNTQGVRLVNLDDTDCVNDVARVVPEEEGEESLEAVGAEPDAE
jgi:DNA gyrase subunit A